MRPLWATLLLALLVGSLAAPTPGAAQSTDPARAAPSADPASLVHRFVAALNAKDLAAALACFADDALYGGGPNGTGGAGKDFIRTRLERDFSVNRRLTVAAISVSGDTVTWSWEAREDPYHPLTIPPITGTDEFVVVNGLIVATSGAVDPDSIRRQQAAIPSAMATLTAQRQAQSTAAARATQVAGSGPLQRLPDTQHPGVPPNVPWAATAAVLLGTSVALAALKRPPSTA